MKNLTQILPVVVIEKLKNYKNLLSWVRNGFSANAPQIVKEKILKRHAIENAPWIETGTYLGTTTKFLIKSFPKVYTIEPDENLFNKAIKRFESKNVELFNGVSEDVLPKLLPNLDGNLNFWLDGHYSEGITFLGKKVCPVEEELIAIEDNLKFFKKVNIFIDDSRCFISDFTIQEYPSIDFVIDWARQNKFSWHIEQDIIILKKN